MAGITVRIGEATWDKLRELAAQEGQPMHVIIEKAVEDYRRKRFLEEANKAFAVLRANTKEWEDELEERKAWDSTLADGLEGN